MLYLISDAALPVSFSSAGNLTNENQFLHPKRIMDSYELISVTKGNLHIQSGDRSYHLTPGQFVLLFPEEYHFGTRPTEGELSFYWTHFHFHAGEATLCEETKTAAFFRENDCPRYILPETGSLSANSRVNVLFVQLLDLAKRLGSLSAVQCNYAQSTLLLELTNECFFRHHMLQQGENIPLNIADLMEWLQLNYDTSLSVAGIAEKFGYHPSYLTAVFKRYSGCTITEYLNRQRIRVAKNLLTSMPKLSLAEISEQTGISDEKYFMRLFKRYEGVTAAAYRKAFPEKRKNRI
ncbi:helix-turn-helix transcriptional regulator [Acetatifactor muris]|uniref:helix-turn-helix transcriptional regulator n=1 Tax=Acetatifactor muris TaxID=879566 RepID=UPI0023EF6E52|nr:AraC family transcriptional regulator [Acetatifactor muris]